MWGKGSPRGYELREPVGSLYGGRRRYEPSGAAPGFVFPMATSGGANLPKIPVATRPPAILSLTSPRLRSSEMIGAFYYNLPSKTSSGTSDVFGPVNLQSESLKAAAFSPRVSVGPSGYDDEREGTAPRRWRGGPRYEPTGFDLSPLITARELQSVGISPLP